MRRAGPEQISAVIRLCSEADENAHSVLKITSWVTGPQ